MQRIVLAALVLAGTLGAESLLPHLQPEQAAEASKIVEAFKQDPRGPFFRIRWFCNDGKDYPPSPYPCADRAEDVSTPR